ncbi:MAG: hypothetical protein LBD32_00350 [Cytophagales bacterium]|jgi:hypothetical protein|nr:hypothetical protein [Cytophagales bacterium]
MNKLLKGSNSKFVGNLFKSFGIALSFVNVSSCEGSDKKDTSGDNSDKAPPAQKKEDDSLTKCPPEVAASLKALNEAKDPASVKKELDSFIPTWDKIDINNRKGLKKIVANGIGEFGLKENSSGSVGFFFKEIVLIDNVGTIEGFKEYLDWCERLRELYGSYVADLGSSRVPFDCLGQISNLGEYKDLFVQKVILRRGSAGDKVVVGFGHNVKEVKFDAALVGKVASLYELCPKLFDKDFKKKVVFKSWDLVNGKVNVGIGGGDGVEVVDLGMISGFRNLIQVSELEGAWGERKVKMFWGAEVVLVPLDDGCSDFEKACGNLQKFFGGLIVNFKGGSKRLRVCFDHGFKARLRSLNSWPLLSNDMDKGHERFMRGVNILVDLGLCFFSFSLDVGELDGGNNQVGFGSGDKDKGISLNSSWNIPKNFVKNSKMEKLIEFLNFLAKDSPQGCTFAVGGGNNVKVSVDGKDYLYELGGASE